MAVPDLDANCLDTQEHCSTFYGERDPSGEFKYILQDEFQGEDDITLCLQGLIAEVCENFPDEVTPEETRRRVQFSSPLVSGTAEMSDDDGQMDDTQPIVDEIVTEIVADLYADQIVPDYEQQEKEKKYQEVTFGDLPSESDSPDMFKTTGVLEPSLHPEVKTEHDNANFVREDHPKVDVSFEIRDNLHEQATIKDINTSSMECVEAILGLSMFPQCEKHYCEMQQEMDGDAELFIREALLEEAPECNQQNNNELRKQNGSSTNIIGSLELDLCLEDESALCIGFPQDDPKVCYTKESVFHPEASVESLYQSGVHSDLPINHTEQFYSRRNVSELYLPRRDQCVPSGETPLLGNTNTLYDNAACLDNRDIEQPLSAISSDAFPVEVQMDIYDQKLVSCKRQRSTSSSTSLHSVDPVPTKKGVSQRLNPDLLNSLPNLMKQEATGKYDIFKNEMMYGNNNSDAVSLDMESHELVLKNSENIIERHVKTNDALVDVSIKDETKNSKKVMTGSFEDAQHLQNKPFHLPEDGDAQGRRSEPEEEHVICTYKDIPVIDAKVARETTIQASPSSSHSVTMNNDESNAGMHIDTITKANPITNGRKNYFVDVKAKNRDHKDQFSKNNTSDSKNKIGSNIYHISKNTKNVSSTIDKTGECHSENRIEQRTSFSSVSVSSTDHVLSNHMTYGGCTKSSSMADDTGFESEICATHPTTCQRQLLTDDDEKQHSVNSSSSVQGFHRTKIQSHCINTAGVQKVDASTITDGQDRSRLIKQPESVFVQSKTQTHIRANNITLTNPSGERRRVPLRLGLSRKSSVSSLHPNYTRRTQPM